MANQMRLNEFMRWLAATKADIVLSPYVIWPCRCGDVNCKGWRLVAPENIPCKSTIST